MIKITRVLDLGDDVLEVQGYDEQTPTQVLKGTGWVSAMTNYYDESQYKNGHLDSKAKSREMNDAEKKSYWLSLLAPSSAVAPLFEDNKALKAHEDAVEEENKKETSEED